MSANQFNLCASRCDQSPGLLCSLSGSSERKKFVPASCSVHSSAVSVYLSTGWHYLYLQFQNVTTVSQTLSHNPNIWTNTHWQLSIGPSGDNYWSLSICSSLTCAHGCVQYATGHKWSHIPNLKYAICPPSRLIQMGLLHKQGFYLCLTLIMSLIIPQHPENPRGTQQLHQMQL